MPSQERCRECHSFGQILTQRSPNFPVTMARAASFGDSRLDTAASIAPVPEDVQNDNFVLGPEDLLKISTSLQATAQQTGLFDDAQEDATSQAELGASAEWVLA